jgi:ubiquinone/menaquinone biosynthesis C-methylase UbiE
MYLPFNPTREEWENREELGPDSDSEMVLNYIQRRFPNAKDILDLGMCKGGLVKRLRELGKNAIGIDLRARAYGGLVIADARKLPFPDESFDIVTEIMLLADMDEFQSLPSTEAKRVILEAKRVLRTGGVFITTPYAILSKAHFNKTIFEDNGVWGVYQKYSLLLHTFHSIKQNL